ncbi:MAG: hypothetical protein JW801_13525 [Bacteroidales bacterium]|nr:hypothetical protein [Bacteroidales bacterium]
MKLFKDLSFFLSILFISGGLHAQKPIILTEETIDFGHGSYNGLSLTIPEVGYNTVEKAWTKLLEKGTKSKIQISEGEYSLFGAQLQEISSEPINVYSTMKSGDSCTLLNVTFELKPKEYLGKASSPSEYTQAKLMLFNFGKELYVELAKEEFKEEEKKLKQLERDLESLYNEKNKLEKSIVNDNSDITEYTDQIALLKQDAENLNTQLSKEKQLLLDLEDEQQRLAKEKEIETIDKNKEKALKEVDSLEKKILLRKSAIDRAKLDIESSKQAQASKLDYIEAQKLVTNQAEKKYNTILEYQ